MSTTAPIYSNPLYTTDTQGKAKAKHELGKDDFLNLLITQLKNQDPLNPLKDTEFIAQLANFSSLEQITNMSSNMEEFLKQQQYQSSAVAVNMIGMEIRTVEGEIGIVSGVTIDDKGVYLIVGDKKIAFSEVKEIKYPVN
jgi:flagellar basal-body rod modification protein FlgD